MATPTPLEISAASFASIRDQLDDGFGLFVDGSITYVVLDAATHSVDVIRRQNEGHFTSLMLGQPGSVRVSVNGQLFGPKNAYSLAAAGSVSPRTVKGEGSIREAGRTLPEDVEKGEARYYFGRTKDGKHYRCDLGNPPDAIYEGMGGVGPLIMTNPVTGTGLAIGAGNRYASDAGKTNIPASDDEWRDCTQRNNEHFVQIDQKIGKEFCAVASSSGARLLLFAIETDDTKGRLTVMRDKLLDAGFDCACFTDGSNSACMAVDDELLVEPNFLKDRLIEAGFKGVKGSKPVRLRVTFSTLDILDAAIVEGDEGRWHVVASVNGEEVGSWSDLTAIAGETHELGWELELEVSSASALALRFEVDNRVSATLSGVDAPEISDYIETLSTDSDPQFGRGAWVVENRDGFYKVHYQVEVL
jgi:hypothetical protein